MTIEEIMTEIHAINAESEISRCLLDWLIDNQGSKTENHPKVKVTAKKREDERHYCKDCMFRATAEEFVRMAPLSNSFYGHECRLTHGYVRIGQAACENWASCQPK